VTVTQNGESVLMANRLHDRLRPDESLEGQILPIYQQD